MNFEGLSYQKRPFQIIDFSVEILIVSGFQNAKLQTEKAKLNPTFNIGYNNMSMYGNGADNKFYERSARFHSGMIGVGLPIFNSAQKSVIEAQKVNQQIAENNYQLGLLNLKNQYLQNLIIQFLKLPQILQILIFKIYQTKLIIIFRN